MQNILDDRLKHSNLGVVLGAIRLFLHFTDNMPDLQSDVHERIRSELSTNTAVYVYYMFSRALIKCV